MCRYVDSHIMRLYQWGSWGARELSTLTKVTLLISDKNRTWPEAVYSRVSTFGHYSTLPPFVLVQIMLFLVKASLPPFRFFHVPIKTRLQEIIFKNFQNDPCWVSNQSRDHFVFMDANGLGSLPGHVTNAEPEILHSEGDPVLEV